MKNRRLLKKRYLAFYVVLASILIASSCMRMRKSDRKIIKVFAKQNVSPTISRITFDDREMRYVEVNQHPEKKMPVIIFVHGAPGSSDNYYEYLYDSTLYQSAVLIAIDRLGYGYSGLGKAECSIKKQSDCLLPILNKYTDRKVILVGHSFGGPIIGRCGIDYPDRINTLMFLAPAIDPAHEKIFWIAHLGRFPPFRWLTPAPLRVATDEKFSHVEELKKMENDWSELKTKVIYIHGEKDMVVPFENYAFAMNKMVNATIDSIAIKKENHFLPWSQDVLIKEKLLDEVQSYQMD